jgi:Ca2+/Na+ antiporter
MGGASVEALLQTAAALSAGDRLELLRGLLSEGDTPEVEAYSQGYVVYASDEGTQHCRSFLLAPGTNLTARGALAFFYLIGLLFVFLGIAIISDIFMEAIEQITSAERTVVRRAAGGELVEWRCRVVNPTIATLTLMALGSSAPEILLSVIGAIRTLDVLPDQLGPSTIVGSAAFNLLMITAICVSALPDGEVKKVRDLGVFTITAAFSVLAYLWLLVVLQLSSPGVVEVWEALLTLALFVLLLVLAYGQDVAWRPCRLPSTVEPVSSSASAPDSGRLSRSHQRSSAADLRTELRRSRALSSGGMLPQRALDDASGTAGHPLEQRYTHTGFMRGLIGQRRLVMHNAEGHAISLPPSRNGSLAPSRRGSLNTPNGSDTGADSSHGAPHPSALVAAAAKLAAEDCIVAFSHSRYVASTSWPSATVVVTVTPPPVQRMTIEWSATPHDSVSSAAAATVSAGGGADVAAVAPEEDAGLTGQLTLQKGQDTAAIEISLARARDACGATAAVGEIGEPASRPEADADGSGYSLEIALESAELDGKRPGICIRFGARATCELVVVRDGGTASGGGRPGGGAHGKASSSGAGPRRGQLAFSESTVVCVESVGKLRVRVERIGGVDGTVQASWKTVDGTAKEEHDYVGGSGVLTFLPFETDKMIEIDIIDDQVMEETETFSIELTALAGDANVLVPERSACVVSILDDDSWKVRKQHARSATAAARTCACLRMALAVLRGRCSECCGARWQSRWCGLQPISPQASSAAAACTFARNNLTIALFRRNCHPMDRTPAFSRARPQQERMGRMRVRVRDALSRELFRSKSWSDRFVDALVLSGGVDDESGDEIPPSAWDSVMHTLSLFWTVRARVQAARCRACARAVCPVPTLSLSVSARLTLFPPTALIAYPSHAQLQFALVPPSSWGGGWPAFFVSLAFIGIWTAITGEIASLLGCVIGLGDPVTAITFVALGTSLPDTFASRSAALHDEYADAAIGNITGSNSVNVFLGLGLPWLIASLYHAFAPSGAGIYRVPAAGLSFSVSLFCIIAVIALVVLMVRRVLIGGELGGKRSTARMVTCFFFGLWLLYIILSSMNALGQLNPRM